MKMMTKTRMVKTMMMMMMMMKTRTRTRTRMMRTMATTTHPPYLNPRQNQTESTVGTLSSVFSVVFCRRLR